MWSWTVTCVTGAGAARSRVRCCAGGRRCGGRGRLPTCRAGVREGPYESDGRGVRVSAARGRARALARERRPSAAAQAQGRAGVAPRGRRREAPPPGLDEVKKISDAPAPLPPLMLVTAVIRWPSVIVAAYDRTLGASSGSWYPVTLPRTGTGHGESLRMTATADSGLGLSGLDAVIWDPNTDPDVRFALELCRAGGLDAFEGQIHGIGACEHPVWLRGETLRRAIDSGEVVTRVSSEEMPLGVLPVRCMNRRASRCRSCAHLYKGDTFQLVLAGLAGGKGVPVAVGAHPSVFVTLTAPSFGAVHRAPDARHPTYVCQPPAKDAEICPHAVRLTCGVRHEPDDVLLGSPLCLACYDYAGQVLWNAYASKLWGALMDTVYHRLAAVSGQRREMVRRLVRVESVRNAEYQARGVVHFHAVLRLDGPGDRGERPPSWATGEALCAAVKSAAETVTVAVPETAELGERVLGFGVEKDARVINASGELSAEKVAAYLAKYVSKSTEDAHGVDSPVTHASQIDMRVGHEHTRTLMHTTWRLGGLAPFAGLGLRRWCHMLGFPGHNTTASRRYSVTRTELARIRQEYVIEKWRERNGATELTRETVREAHWQYVFSGYPTAPMANFATSIREEIEFAREEARDAAAQERTERQVNDWALPDE